jgi:hypothetical protein
MMPPVSRAARLCIAALTSFTSLLVSLAAIGQEPTPTRARLEWKRGENSDACIDGPALKEAVDRRWGRRVFVDDATGDVIVKGMVKRRRGAWSVHLELERADGSKLGSRDIVTRSSECSSLDDSVALALGLMLDLTERAEAPGGAQGGSPLPAKPPITIPEETVAPRVPWRFEPTLAGEAEVGLMPGVAFGGRLALGIEPPRVWRIEAGGTLWQERDAQIGSAGTRFSMWTLDLAICPVSMGQEPLNAWICIAQRAGTVRAEGTGFDRNAVQRETFLAAEARSGLTWAFAGPLVLHAAFGLEVPLVRLEFVFRDAEGDLRSVYRMSPIAGVLGVGIGARF